jgi:hypothetical protein
MQMYQFLQMLTLIVTLIFLLTGCATSTIETRRAEYMDVYNGLSQEFKQLVDSGMIKVGMPKEAVYIAWGAPAERLESEDFNGKIETWLYYGAWLKERRYWTFREISRDGVNYLERYLEREYDPQKYVRAELTFKNNILIKWRTLPKPVD